MKVKLYAYMDLEDQVLDICGELDTYEAADVMSELVYGHMERWGEKTYTPRVVYLCLELDTKTGQLTILPNKEVKG